MSLILATFKYMELSHYQVNSNIQITNSKQYPNLNAQNSKHILSNDPGSFFFFGNWNVFGVWFLLFGISASLGNWVKSREKYVQKNCQK
jgi:hypothetical protein